MLYARSTGSTYRGGLKSDSDHLVHRNMEPLAIHLFHDLGLDAAGPDMHENKVMHLRFFPQGLGQLDSAATGNRIPHTVSHGCGETVDVSDKDKDWEDS